jgi:histidyl-tRNA synthetase
VEALVATLHERGIGNAKVDLDVVRGFDYYTGTVFEIFDTNPENARSLFGGGRYDGLVSLFDAEPVPAVGFALGDVTLADFLATHGYGVGGGSKTDVYVGTPSADDFPAARAFADELRASGANVFMNLTEKALGDQVKDAVKRGIPYFIAFGRNEAGSGSVKVKVLAESREEEVARAAAAARVKARA